MALLNMVLYPFKLLVEYVQGMATDQPIQGDTADEILLDMVRKAERDNTRRLKADHAVSCIEQTPGQARYQYLLTRLGITHDSRKVTRNR